LCFSLANIQIEIQQFLGSFGNSYYTTTHAYKKLYPFNLCESVCVYWLITYNSFEQFWKKSFFRTWNLSEVRLSKTEILELYRNLNKKSGIIKTGWQQGWDIIFPEILCISKYMWLMVYSLYKHFYLSYIST